MMPAILLSGVMTPIRSMPGWLQALTYLNPVRYYAEVMRATLLKGAGFADLWFQLAALLCSGARSSRLRPCASRSGSGEQRRAFSAVRSVAPGYSACAWTPSSRSGESRKGTASLVALAGVDLDIRARRDLRRCSGPNGAGKTTLISIVAGLVRPSAGEAPVLGRDVVRDYRVTRRAVGLVPQEINFDPFFTVEETLRFQAGYFGVRLAEERLVEILEALELLAKRTTNTRALSGGMKRRLLIGKALVHEPRVLFLDEPTAGVDVELRRALWTLRAARCATAAPPIVLTTHYLEEAEELADRIGRHRPRAAARWSRRRTRSCRATAPRRCGSRSTRPLAARARGAGGAGRPARGGRSGRHVEAPAGGRVRPAPGGGRGAAAGGARRGDAADHARGRVRAARLAATAAEARGGAVISLGLRTLFAEGGAPVPPRARADAALPADHHLPLLRRVRLLAGRRGSGRSRACPTRASSCPGW